MTKRSLYMYGNTTVRNAIRFSSGLKLLEESKYNGNINSKINELEFAKLLDKNNVVSMSQAKKPDDSLGRKWRSAFDKTGFITPLTCGRKNLDKNHGIDPLASAVKKAYPILNISGKAYEVTPQGHRLAQANNIYEMQDTILRALLAIQIDSFDVYGEKFKPFVFVLQVMEKLKLLGETKGVNREELVIISACTDYTKAKQVAEDIIEYRKGRNNETGKINKSRYDRKMLAKYAEEVNIKYESAITYADPNFKYMLATGLFSRQGRRLIFNNDRRAIIDAILKEEPKIFKNEIEYYYHLWQGYPLPNDNKEILLKEIQSLATSADQLVPREIAKKSIPDLKQLKLILEQKNDNSREQIYAKEQEKAENITSIISYLKVINGDIKAGDEYDNAKEDMPSFFEWVTWRAFLAIDGLECKSYEARGFKVDHDFFPIGNAPGGQPDITLVFDDYVLVVEVTLTTSSRQEASEAEPVRRHVAQVQAKYSEKPVYGLFIAPSIDNNTAEMFRTGIWYKNDEPKFVNIVPITLKQFIYIMSDFAKQKFTNASVERLIEKCLIPRIATVPIWKKEIHKMIMSYYGVCK